MKRYALAALLAAASLTPTLAAAAPITVTSGTRGATIGSVGPIGQSFVASDPLLTSFGFQFAVANSSQTDASVIFSLLSGADLTGPLITTRSAVLSGLSGRTPVFYDFDLTGTALTVGQSYTAVVSAASTRLALIFGPNLGISGVPASGDAYAAGSLLSTRPVDNYCTTSGACDANFRTNAVSAAVPEPATWAMFIIGFGFIGRVARHRRRNRPMGIGLGRESTAKGRQPFRM